MHRVSDGPRHGNQGIGLIAKYDGGDVHFAGVHQVQELRSELGSLEGKIPQGFSVQRVV